MLIVDEADVMFENANAIEIEQIVEAVPEVKQVSTCDWVLFYANFLSCA